MSSTAKLKKANKAFRDTLEEGARIRVIRTTEVTNGNNEDKTRRKSTRTPVGIRRK